MYIQIPKSKTINCIILVLLILYSKSTFPYGLNAKLPKNFHKTKRIHQSVFHKKFILSEFIPTELSLGILNNGELCRSS